MSRQIVMLSNSNNLFPKIIFLLLGIIGCKDPKVETYIPERPGFQIEQGHRVFYLGCKQSHWYRIWCRGEDDCVILDARDPIWKDLDKRK